MTDPRNVKPVNRERHVVEIVNWFDFEAQNWKAEIRLKEFRCGSQYGGTVVWELSATKAQRNYDVWMRSVCRVAGKKALGLITFKV